MNPPRLNIYLIALIVLSTTKNHAKKKCSHFLEKCRKNLLDFIVLYILFMKGTPRRRIIVVFKYLSSCRKGLGRAESYSEEENNGYVVFK
jgi:hypothetical protein